MTAFIPYLATQASNFLPWLLQCLGHVQSKNKDAKSAVSCFFFIEKCSQFHEHLETLAVLKGLTISLASPMVK